MNKKIRIVSVILLCALLTGCTSAEAANLVKSEKYRDYDMASELGITFDDNTQIGNPCGEYGDAGEKKPNSTDSCVFRMRVYDAMDVYESIGDKKSVATLPEGTVVDMAETNSEEWMKVTSTDGELLGYAKDGFLHAIDSDCAVFAELPIEYGKARTNSNTFVDAYSHLVDIRKYLKVYESTEYSNEGVDLSQYDVKVSMKLSTSDTTIKEPFYSSNLCMLQYDVLLKLMKAIEIFKKDGYTVVIYDAYRPTSVQQRWFDVVRVHKWVADPSIGMGGVHDRGAAIDMSLINTKTGVELEMPTPMHTFTEASARSSTTMTQT
ncbi:MAG: M15 family metallopeptidase, partial [bacterium]|nr:M15 family metallopeptidase [bacterium]